MRLTPEQWREVAKWASGCNRQDSETIEELVFTLDALHAELEAAKAFLNWGDNARFALFMVSLKNAEDLRAQLAAVTAERDALRAELDEINSTEYGGP